VEEEKEHAVEYHGDSCRRIPGRDPVRRDPVVASCMQPGIHFIYRCTIYIGVIGLCDRTCNNNAGSAVYAARAGDPSAADPDRRAWSDCLCYGVFFASQEEDHGKGAGSDPGDV